MRSLASKALHSRWRAGTHEVPALISPEDLLPSPSRKVSSFTWIVPPVGFTAQVGHLSDPRRAKDVP